MSARRFCRLARGPVFSAQQQMRYVKRLATTLSAQDAGMQADGRDKSYGPANPPENPYHRGHENSYSRSPKTLYTRSPETPNLRRPAETQSRVGTSGLGYGRHEAGDTNRTANVDSAYLGQADDVHVMRSAYNDAQERHLRYGTNARVLNRDSTVSPLDRDVPRPDAASANAGVMNRMPPNNPLAAANQRPPGNIPQQHNSTSLAQEYHVRKAQIHASLWQQELRKQGGDLKGNVDLSSDTLISTSNSREGKETFGWDVNETMPEDWETFDPPDGEFYDASAAKEEALMFEEFEKRRERNRIQIASFVKQHLYGRRRPVDGWKYIINNFGTDSKAAKGSALGGRQTTGNDLEKLALKRESGQLRRKA